MKKYISLFIVAILTISFFVSCKKQPDITDESSSTGSQTEKLEETQLTVYSLFGEEDTSFEEYKALMDEFTAANATVSVVNVAKSYSEAVQTEIDEAFIAGQEPDVLFFHTGEHAATFAKSDVVVPVDEIREQYKSYASDVMQMSLDTMKEKDGIVYAVPVRGFFECLFVNTDVFEQCGVAVPKDYETLLSAVKAFAEKGVVPIAVSLTQAPEYLIDNLLLAAAGKDKFAIGVTDAEGVSQAWERAFGLLTELYSAGAFPAEEVSEKEATDMFLQKRAAMQLDSSLFIARIDDAGNGETTSAIAFPSLSGEGSAGMVGGFSSGFYITRKAWNDPAKRAAAVAFVNKMTSMNSVTRLTRYIGAPSTKVILPTEGSTLQNNATAIFQNTGGLIMPMKTRLSHTEYSMLLQIIPNVAKGEVKPKDAASKLFAGVAQ